jgi:hypothetical protein
MLLMRDTKSRTRRLENLGSRCMISFKVDFLTDVMEESWRAVAVIRLFAPFTKQH